MAAAQKLAAAADGGGCAAGRPGSDHFPAGLRVLVVDDDAICLRILDKMLNKCCYEVTTCSRATDALSLLRERKGSFDLVISDVHMPNMDGFKLLEHVGLEMDLPVIMMSADGSTSAVMKGIKHGACDYIIKPVRMEELQNIWQHVVRKRWNENKENDNSSSAEDIDRNNRCANDETDYCSTLSEGTDVSSWKSLKKRKDSKEDEEGELENDDSSASKKPRVVWSVDLHQQFVNAVNQLGIDKAVPKRILELMNVPGITRENVASHLQKFRLYLKRISVAQHQGGLPNSFCGSVDSNQKLSPGGRFDFQAIASSGHIAPQTLAALQSEILGKPKSSLVLPGMDSALLLAPSMQGSNCLPPECGPVTFGHPLMKCSTVINKKYSQPFGDTSGFNSWSSTHLGTMGVSVSLSGAIPTDSKMIVQMLHQQRQQSTPPETCHSINVQPSCVVVPSEVPNAFQSGSDGAISQACAYSGNPVIGYDTLPQSNNMSCGTGQISEQNVGVLTGYSATSFSPALSSCSVSSEKQTAWQLQNSASYSNFSGNRLPELVPHVFELSNFHDTKKEPSSDQLLGRNLGFVGKQTNIPSRYAADDIQLLTTGSTNSKNCSDGLVHYNLVKQELNLDTVESTKGGLPGVHYSSSDLMGVLSK